MKRWKVENRAKERMPVMIPAKQARADRIMKARVTFQYATGNKTESSSYIQGAGR